MSGGAHFVYGFIVGALVAPVIETTYEPAVGAMVLVTFGSMFPDIDNPNSKIASILPVLAIIISRLRLGHRNLLHSPIFLLFLFGLVGKYTLGRAFCIGYMCHLVQDLCTCGGIPLLYPNKKRYSLLPFRSGTIFDYITTLGLLLIAITIKALVFD